MNIEEYREYCISKKGVSEDFPFDNRTLVFKVGGKMFALTDVEDFNFINLKGKPEENEALRNEYDGIKPGYHMNKVHWNSVYIASDVNDKILKQMIDTSYNLVISSLSKKQKELL